MEDPTLELERGRALEAGMATMLSPVVVAAKHTYMKVDIHIMVRPP